MNDNKSNQTIIINNHLSPARKTMWNADHKLLHSNSSESDSHMLILLHREQNHIYWIYLYCTIIFVILLFWLIRSGF